MHGELLLRRPELSPDARAELTRMHTATIRASRLATQLLALAKAESDPGHIQRLETIDLATIGHAAARDWAPKAVASKIDLGFSLEQAMIEGDPVLLPELLSNLIDNALRYTPAPGTVTVHTGELNGTAYLCVEDSGPGIPVEETRNVVERFYRTPGRPGEGSGLGLAIVKEVVERHRGVLEIRPRSEGSPFSVRVSFPRYEAKR
jgi:two-component system sensor histidine kinase TctE